jgi:hypothetical protein
VPKLAVEGLNQATEKARKAGEILVVRGSDLLRLQDNAVIEVIQKVSGRKKVKTRTKRLKG